MAPASARVGGVEAPTLTDGTVTLRAHRADDVDALVVQCSDPEMGRWTTVPVPFTRAHAVDWVTSRAQAWADGQGELTLVVEVGGVLAGQVGLRPDGAGAAEIGYGLAAAARGRGVMSAALRLAVAWAFESLGVEVVHWQAHVGNWDSRRVAWATGFTIEGKVRRLCPHRGERRDSWIGSIRADDPMMPSIRWLEVPELRSGSVVLRPHVAEDSVRVAEACAHDSTQAWLPDLPSPYTLADAVEYVESREEQHAAGLGLYWALADAASDQLLGAMGVMGLGAGASRSGEVGYWAHPDSHGRGAMTEAVRLAARHALLPADDGGLGLQRVFARVAAGNEASARVLVKAGFTEVGVDRCAERLRDGSVVDFLRFDLVAAELDAPGDEVT